MKNNKNNKKVKNNNNVTELVFILDRSGSMFSLTEDTIGGFNSMISEQKQKEGECIVSTVLFNDRVQVLHDRVALKDVPLMTAEQYSAGGCTAMLDAVGGAIHHIAKVHKHKGKDCTARTVFLITTDGLENASKRYSLAKVKQMISLEQKRYGWDFVFIGANMDAVSVAEDMGISKELAATSSASGSGVKSVYRAMSSIVGLRRCNEAVPMEWKDEVE